MTPLNSARALAFAFVYSLASFTAARADLQVYPLRTVLSDQKRSSSLTLKHLGANEETYKISVVFYRENSEGKMEMVAKPELTDRSAKEFIKFSPREVTMTPGSEQTVRLMLFNPKPSSGDGDYRAYLRFEPVNGSKKSLGDGSGKQAVQMALAVKLSVSVPVLYRHGKSESHLSFKNLKVKPSTDPQFWQVEFLAEKEGNAMPSTDLRLIHISERGEESEVGKVTGYAFYNSKKVVKVQLAKTGQVPEPFATQKFRLEANEIADEGGKLLSIVSNSIE